MTEIFASLWGPLIIFGLRIIDVSLATLRMLLTMRNARRLVPVIGLFESLIWVVAAWAFLPASMLMRGVAMWRGRKQICGRRFR